MDEQLLREIVRRLELHRQAATYGAIAGIVGGSHRTVMADEPRNQRNSWVVNKRSQRPTGYEPAQLHSELLTAIEARGVIESPEELDDWLGSHS